MNVTRRYFGKIMLTAGAAVAASGGAAILPARQKLALGPGFVLADSRIIAKRLGLLFMDKPAIKNDEGQMILAVSRALRICVSSTLEHVYYDHLCDHLSVELGRLYFKRLHVIVIAPSWQGEPRRILCSGETAQNA